MRGNVKYLMSKRLELLRYRLLQWNQEEVGDIFRRLESMKVAITDLQAKKDHENALSDRDMVDL